MTVLTENLTESGFSLIELMIAIAISAVLAAGIFKVFIAQNKVYSVQDQILERQQNVRTGLDNITRSLQAVGYDPTESKNFGITAYQAAAPFFPASSTAAMALATNTELYFTTDDSEDGTINNDGNERFGFKIVSNNLVAAYILAADGNIASWQPIAENIESMTVSYTYADGTVSTVVGLPDNAVSNRNFEDIRAATVTLTARTSKVDPDFTDPSVGDHYHRVTLSSTVMLRNLSY
jgi:prepilin-type N-terminal cleavage/methylation domain-containing protein